MKEKHSMPQERLTRGSDTVGAGEVAMSGKGCEGDGAGVN